MKADKIVMRLDKARHLGWIAYDAIDLTCNEWLTGSDEVRNLRQEYDESGSKILLIETAPMPNPNGAGSTVIGRVVWAETSN